MDQTQPEPTFDESVKQVMKTLPPPIRNYLGQGKYTDVVKSMMTKYNLRIDQGGVLEREMMLLLMGIENPDEFTKALAEEAKLDQGTINSIVQDVNEQIFMPLREEMRKGPAPVPQQRPQSAAVQAPRPVNAQMPRYAPPAPQRAVQSADQRYFHLQNKIPPPVRPIRAPQGGAQGDRSDLRNVLSSVMKEIPMPRSDEKLLEDHEEPHIEFHPTSPMATKGTIENAPLRPSVAPSVGGPPPNLPGALPPLPTPAPPKATRGTAPPTRPPYSSDPYREPIEP